MKAVAIWNPDKKSPYSYSSENIRGFVIFTQLEECLKVNIFIEGLSDGKHGIHIHQKGVKDVSDLDSKNCCELLGGHFNLGESWSLTEPYGAKHGSHTGDMCLNIESFDGQATHTYYDYKISLREDEENCVLNRSVVIHQDEDDLGKGFYSNEEKNIQSLITGNSGDRIACAEIRFINDEEF